MFQMVIRSFASLSVLAALEARFALSEPGGRTSSTISGIAAVIDGDTITIGERKVRLNGFDTPERNSLCGATDVYVAASNALADFIAEQKVTCELNGEMSYDRAVGTCSANGTDFGTFMVKSGWGRDWRKYSNGEYADEETAARSAGAGIWGLACPSDLWGDRNYD